MKLLRASLGIVAVTALALSSTTSHKVAWSVVALVAGLALFVAAFFEIRARRRARAAG